VYEISVRDFGCLVNTSAPFSVTSTMSASNSPKDFNDFTALFSWIAFLATSSSSTLENLIYKLNTIPGLIIAGFFADIIKWRSRKSSPIANPKFFGKCATRGSLPEDTSDRIHLIIGGWLIADSKNYEA
jgi:hypothetical protein